MLWWEKIWMALLKAEDLVLKDELKNKWWSKQFCLGVFPLNIEKSSR